MSGAIAIIEKHCIPVTESGCWLWQFSENMRGYGQLTFEKKHYAAHKFSYQIYRGEIPKGMTIDHLCRVRCCVNPNHMELVSNKENVLRGVGITAINAKKTHCKHGHEFTNENTYTYKYRASGGRSCLSCTRRRKSEAKKKI